MKGSDSRAGDRVDIVIPHYGDDALLQRCLDSLRAHTPQPHQIIVEDNNPPRENRGFARAVNAGLAQSTGDYVVFLNNDCEVPANWLDGMLACLRADPEVACCGPLSDAPTHWQWVHQVAHRLSRNLPAAGGYVTDRDAPGLVVTFWCTAFPRWAFDRVGLLDERFFMYYEDTDWTTRAQAAGYKLGLDLSTVVHHAHQSVRREETAGQMEASLRQFQAKWGLRETPKVLVAVLNQGVNRVELTQALLNIATADSGVAEPRIVFRDAKDIANNRNRIVQEFLTGPADYLLMVDGDQAFYRNPLDLVALDRDIIGLMTPIFNNVKSPNYPILMNVAEDSDDGLWGLKALDPRAGLMEVDAIGTGAILIARRVLEHPALRAPFLPAYDADGIMERGEDFEFCRRARAAGFKVWIHTDYFCEHWWSLPMLQIAQQVNGLRLSDNRQSLVAA